MAWQHQNGREALLDYRGPRRAPAGAELVEIEYRRAHPADLSAETDLAVCHGFDVRDGCSSGIDDPSAAEDFLSGLVQAFRSAAGRPDA